MGALANALGWLRNYFVTIPLVYLFTIFMGAVSLLVSVADSSGRMQHWCARWWARGLLVFSRIRVTVRGTGNIPQGPCIFAANHQSYMDVPVAFAYIPGNFRIMAKASLFYIPFLGWHLKRSGHMPIARDNPHRAARSLLSAAAHVRSGMCVFIFPEGGRSAHGRIDTFKAGTFLLAIKSGAPVVPVTINGARAVLPMHSWRVRLGHIEIVFHPPIATAGLTTHSAADLAEKVRAAIASEFRTEEQELAREPQGAASL